VKQTDASQVTGIILAGGKSSRLGFDKGLADFHGKPLIQYSIHALEPLCSSIIVSANDPAYRSLGYPVQEDIIPDAGPIGGIYSCLLNSATDHNLILSCDTPFITTGLMQMILDHSSGYQIVIPESRPGYIEPLCGYYHKNNVPTLSEFINQGDLKLIRYIETAHHKVIPAHAYSIQFTNMNTPKDLNIPLTGPE
jgi:molybdopterin-guanine dinucleotide biosynthesis protein A